MSLFHRWNNQEFQFILDVLAMVESTDQPLAMAESTDQTLDAAQLNALAERHNVDPGRVGDLLKMLAMPPFENDEFSPFLDAVAGTQGSYQRHVKPTDLPFLPLSTAEERYLQQILRMQEAELFLPDELRDKLRQDPPAPEDGTAFRDFLPAGEQNLPGLTREQFGILLDAIEGQTAIAYKYTRADKTPSEVVGFPYRVEYDGYDRRWWMVLYLPAEDRMIKARLSRIQSLEARKDLSIDNQKFAEAYDKLLALEPEPVRLRISSNPDAMERFFLAFEHQDFIESKPLGKHGYEVSFRFFPFERRDILRQLLALGHHVTLLGPKDLQQELLALVEQALANFEEN